MRRRFMWLAALVVCASAIASGDSPVSSVQVTQAWVRWLPGNIPAGGYLTLNNQGAAPVVLIGASSNDYSSVSLHQSREQDGVSSMTAVGGITLRPHASLNFGSEGYHLMLMQPTRPLKAGDKVLITLHFTGGGTIAVPFQLRSPDMLMSK